MSVDTKHALRHVLCLANPSRMQAARWESVDTKHALRHVLCLANPSRMQAARWESVDTKHALRHVLATGAEACRFERRWAKQRIGCALRTRLEVKQAPRCNVINGTDAWNFRDNP